MVPPRAAVFYMALHLDIYNLFFSSMVIPGLVPMAKKRTGG